MSVARLDRLILPQADDQAPSGCARPTAPGGKRCTATPAQTRWILPNDGFGRPGELVDSSTLHLTDQHHYGRCTFVRRPEALRPRAWVLRAHPNTQHPASQPSPTPNTQSPGRAQHPTSNLPRRDPTRPAGLGKASAGQGINWARHQLMHTYPPAPGSHRSTPNTPRRWRGPTPNTQASGRGPNTQHPAR